MSSAMTAAAVAKNECGLLAGHRVTTLLANLEILGIVHRAAGIGAAVVGNDFVFIRESILNE